MPLCFQLSTEKLPKWKLRRCEVFCHVQKPSVQKNKLPKSSYFVGVGGEGVLLAPIVEERALCLVVLKGAFLSSFLTPLSFPVKNEYK